MLCVVVFGWIGVVKWVLIVVLKLFKGFLLVKIVLLKLRVIGICKFLWDIKNSKWVYLFDLFVYVKWVLGNLDVINWKISVILGELGILVKIGVVLYL